MSQRTRPHRGTMTSANVLGAAAKAQRSLRRADQSLSQPRPLTHSFAEVPVLGPPRTGRLEAASPGVAPNTAPGLDGQIQRQRVNREPPVTPAYLRNSMNGFEFVEADTDEEMIDDG